MKAAAPPKPPCRHCQRARVSRPRGLCWHCYYTPGVRGAHTSGSPFARRGVPDFEGPAPLPPPTRALPGTPEKVGILEERARLGQSLWHPQDAPLTDADRPAQLLREGRHDGPARARDGGRRVRVLLDFLPRHYLESPLDPVED